MPNRPSTPQASSTSTKTRAKSPTVLLPLTLVVLAQILDKLKIGVKVVDACILADRLIES